MDEAAVRDSVVVGLDLGTTTCKGVALDERGAARAVVENTYDLKANQRGWVEQEAVEVWRGAVQTLRGLMSRFDPEQVLALSVGGAMHTLLPVNTEGAPLAPAMSWADSRAKPQVRELRGRTDAHALYLRTGCPLRNTYHPARLRWWQEEAPEITRRAEYWVSIKDWILFRLTGTWATDFSYASTTGLLNIHNLTWEKEALALSGITVERLPRLVSPFETVGQVTAMVEEETGLPAGLSVIAGGNDGALAQLGANAGESGSFVVTVGTSGAIRRVVEQPMLDPAERTWCYVLDTERWFVGGAVNNGGLVQHWLWKRFYADEPSEIEYEQLTSDAASIPPGSEGLLVLPYFTGERSPHWNPNLRATIHGLNLAHTRAHIVRATLEGVAFTLSDVWEALCGEELPEEPVKLTGGITHSPIWAQIVADVLGATLIPIESADASAVGAALVGYASLGHTVFPRGVANAPTNTRYEPDPGRHQLYVDRHRAFQALYRQLAAR
ncbi:MAG: gluconokinase [Chloroflexota bacterium]|nr:gluconokinase [Chloroflexota bacterium]